MCEFSDDPPSSRIAEVGGVRTRSLGFVRGRLPNSRATSVEMHHPRWFISPRSVCSVPWPTGRAGVKKQRLQIGTMHAHSQNKTLEGSEGCFVDSDSIAVLSIALTDCGYWPQFNDSTATHKNRN